MTAPTITYEHAFMNDMDLASYWGAKTDSADPLTAVTIVSDGDVITIQGTTDNVADEYVHYNKTTAAINTSYYTKYLIRWKTSLASDGLGLQVTLFFTAGSGGGSQELLEATGIPQFSTAWKVTSGTITPGRVIETVRITANDYPNNCTNGTSSVSLDFILLCRNVYTLPYVTDVTELEITPRYADFGTGRIGDMSQYGGEESPIIHLSGDIDQATTWHGDTTMDAEKMYRMCRDAYADPWQWFTSDLIHCKVTPRRFTIGQYGNKDAVKSWSLDLKKYSLGNEGNYAWEFYTGIAT